MCRPTRRPYRGRLKWLGEMSLVTFTSWISSKYSFSRPDFVGVAYARPHQNHCSKGSSAMMSSKYLPQSSRLPGSGLVPPAPNPACLAALSHSYWPSFARLRLFVHKRTDRCPCRRHPRGESTSASMKRCVSARPYDGLFKGTLREQARAAGEQVLAPFSFCLESCRQALRARTSRFRSESDRRRQNYLF